MTEVEGLLADLRTALFTAGMVDADGEAIESDEDIPMVVTYQADSVGALWNYILVSEDMSSGIHNPAYVVALLTNTLESLQ